MKQFLPLIAIVGVVFAGCSSSKESGGEETASVPFAATGVILTKNCVGCHGDQNPKEGIALTNFAAVMKGGKDGPIVKAGDAEGSQLVQALRGTHGVDKMPPKSPGLPEADIATVEAWIKAGAKE